MDMDTLVRSFLTPQRKEELSAFIGLVQKNPQVLYHPELAFFKTFLESFGAKLPEQEQPKPAPEPAPEAKPEPAKEDAAPAPEESNEKEKEEEEEEEPEQPDDELMEPDEGAELPSGADKTEVTDDDRAAAAEAKAKAVAAQREGRLDEALALFTAAIERNPTSSLTFGGRAALLLQLRRPRAAVRDCDRALQLNPESAKALKVRGKAYRYLGEYERAKKDLQAGNQLDFDDETFAMQKFLEDRLRGKEGRAMARAARERDREAARKQREFEERKRRWEEQRRREQEAEAAEEEERKRHEGGMPGCGMPGGMPGCGGMPGLNELFSDPEIMAAMQDPAVQKTLLDVLQSKDPMKFMQAQQDPKVGPVLTKILSKLGAQAGAAQGGCAGGCCGGRGGCGAGACGAGGCGCGGMPNMGGFQFPH